MLNLIDKTGDWAVEKLPFPVFEALLCLASFGLYILYSVYSVTRVQFNPYLCFTFIGGFLFPFGLLSLGVTFGVLSGFHIAIIGLVILFFAHLKYLKFLFNLAILIGPFAIKEFFAHFEH